MRTLAMVALLLGLGSEALAVPETGAATKAGGGSFKSRLLFSTLVPPRVLETTLDAGKQWAAWETLARGGGQ